MARRSPGRVAFGLLLVVSAAAASAAAWFDVAPMPVPKMVVLASAAVLLVLGLAIALTGRRAPQPEASIPAHIAFAMRTPQELRPAPRGARPAMARPEATDPHSIALQDIDDEVRDLTRRINKAGVMLATGKLSGDAYTKYVDELKRQRGSLEADRVHLELRKRTA